MPTPLYGSLLGLVPNVIDQFDLTPFVCAIDSVSRAAGSAGLLKATFFLKRSVSKDCG